MQKNYDLCFKTPQKRWIFVPTNECRLKGEAFVEEIAKKWSPPGCFYHFKSGGHVAAIKLHKKHQYFAKLDIQKFFPSITKSKVVRSLKLAGFPYTRALTIAEWSVVASKDDKGKRILPYGFIQSQLIAAVCMDCSAMGSFVRNQIPKGVAISIYVDDIIISSNNKNQLEEVYEGLVSAIEAAGFLVNEEKSHSPKDSSTAFNIDFDNSKMAITDKRFSDFLASISPIEDKKTEAIIAYVNSVNKEQALALIESLESAN